MWEESEGLEAQAAKIIGIDVHVERPKIACWHAKPIWFVDRAS